MRSCLLLLILLALIIASGYCIWEVRETRALVDEIHADLLRERENERNSMIEHARQALEALGRGEIEDAQAELRRLSELVERTGALAGQQREVLRGRLREAKEAIDRGSARASELVERLVRELSRRDERERPKEQGDEPGEP